MLEPTESHSPHYAAKSTPESVVLTSTLPEYDTGVSNGDVDWLFRGKSRKLTKKKQHSEKEKKLNESDHPVNDTVQSSRKNSNSTNRDLDMTTSNQESSTIILPTASKVNSDQILPAVNKNLLLDSGKHDHLATNDNNRGPIVDNKVASVDTPKLNPPIPSPEDLKDTKDPKEKLEKVSKLDKFKLGRGRSISSVVPPVTVAEVPDAKRRVSVGTIPGVVAPSLSSSSSPSSSSPSAKQELAPGDLSRSNSSGSSNPGQKKKSLFSSFLSRFKSGSSQQPSSSSSPSKEQDHQGKLHPNILGVSGHHHSTESQNLAALVNTPPNGIPKKKPPVSHNPSSGSPLTTKQPVDPPTSKEAEDFRSVKLKRVAFAINKLAYDPQQQIPSRRPKKGNVLIPEDLVAPPPRLSQGISMVDGKVAGQQSPRCLDSELQAAIEAQKKALIEANKHAQEANLVAKKLALEVAQYNKNRRKLIEQNGPNEPNDDEEVHQDHEASNLEIDKPIHVHEAHFEGEITDHHEDNEEDIIATLNLDTIYTRCCHLREILPIPATLKQLKNKSKPLQVLKLLNPKPTLIDVLSFSDFLTITPVNTVIFDNVTMTTEMLKIFLTSLVNNPSLEKLSLRNVAIDPTGWTYLCKFLEINKSLKKLDISQQKIKTDAPTNVIRSNMNWVLFIKSIVLHGGIEELVINGCKISEVILSHLISKTVMASTYRLGIAGIDLTVKKAQVVADWIMSPISKCVGVDIAFNDLSQGQLTPLIKAFSKGNLKLLFLSLNSTNLSNVNEFTELLSSLTMMSGLRFLDLSSLPQLFPLVISKLNKFLPMMKDLRRIHFDLNELTSLSISAIADIIPKVSTLHHVSFIGNRDLNRSAIATLYAAAKTSKSLLALDLDYELVPDEMSQRIAFYLMKNMDRTINSDTKDTNDDNEEELMFDGTLLMESAEKLLNAEGEKDSGDSKSTNSKEGELKIEKLITSALIKRTRSVRKDIHNKLDALFAKRSKEVLTFDEKEKLLRLCLLDSSLERIVKLYEERAKSNYYGGEALTPSQSEDVNNTPMLPSLAVNGGAAGVDNAMSSNLLTAVHDSLHENSNELIVAGPLLSPRNVSETKNQRSYFDEPHSVVEVASADGTSVPIDTLTGRPVLLRSISHTSTHAKEQEEEEGEFHRWGIFMQQQGDGDDEASKNEPLPTLNVLPSGSELRDAVIAAKGIESVNDLINNIYNLRVSLEKIYRQALADEVNKSMPTEREKEKEKDYPEKKSSIEDTKPLSLESDSDEDYASIDSTGDAESHGVNAKVDEVYDRLLNDAERVRSNNCVK